MEHLKTYFQEVKKIVDDLDFDSLTIDSVFFSSRSILGRPGVLHRPAMN